MKGKYHREKYLEITKLINDSKIQINTKDIDFDTYANYKMQIHSLNIGKLCINRSYIELWYYLIQKSYINLSKLYEILREQALENGKYDEFMRKIEILSQKLK